MRGYVKGRLKMRNREIGVEYTLKWGASQSRQISFANNSCSSPVVFMNY